MNMAVQNTDESLGSRQDSLTVLERRLADVSDALDHVEPMLDGVDTEMRAGRIDSDTLKRLAREIVHLEAEARSQIGHVEALVAEIEAVDEAAKPFTLGDDPPNC